MSTESGIDIFQNPDFLEMISNNFNYLSLSDRVAFYSMLNSLPEIEKMGQNNRDKILIDAFKNWILNNKGKYKTARLTKTIVVRNSMLDYDFSVVYPKDFPKPTIDEVKLADIISDFNPGEINQILPPDTFIWNLTGIAGMARYSDILYHFFSNDIGTMSVKLFDINNSLLKEIWYRNGRKHRDFDKPAVVHYPDNVIGMKEWYRNGVAYKEETYTSDGTPEITRYYADGEIKTICQHY